MNTVAAMADKWESDPRTFHTSLAELCSILGAPIAVCSAPETQLNGKQAMKAVEQLPMKVKPEFQRKITSIVDAEGSTNGAWTSQKIRTLNAHGCITHEDDFDRDLTGATDFDKYLKQNWADFEEKAKFRCRGGNLDDKIRKLAVKGFAVRNSQWNSYWRGKVVGGLTMALTMMEPKELTAEDLRSVGIGKTMMDINELHVVIAAVIDGGHVTQEEQREIPEMIDEVVFDLRRRGYSWAANALVLLVRFPDIESIVKSLDGEKNLVRSHRLKTRQVDHLKFGSKALRLPMAWEFDPPLTSLKTNTLLNNDISFEEALTIVPDVSPVTLYQCAISGDAVGAKRLIEAKSRVDKARSGTITALAASAIGNHVDVMTVLLGAVPDPPLYANQPNSKSITPAYLAASYGQTEALHVLVRARADINMTSGEGATPLYVAAKNGHIDAVNVLVKAGADIDMPINAGHTSIFIAASMNHKDIVKTLVSARANVNKTDAGKTPFKQAMSLGLVDMMTVLDQHGGVP